MISTEKSQAEVVHWISVSLSSGLICRIHQPTSLPTALLEVSSIHGVAVDWHHINEAIAEQRKKLEEPPSSVELRVSLSALVARGGKILTSIRIDKIWENFPLNEASKQLSSFAVGSEMFCFQRGTAGRVSVRHSALLILGSVVDQLNQQGCPCIAMYDDILIASSGHEEALHRTASVHKTLRAAQLQIHGRDSCFIPREAVFLIQGKIWCTLDLESFQERLELWAAFLSECFVRKCRDGHRWKCESPIVSSCGREFDDFCKLVYKTYPSLAHHEVKFDDAVLEATNAPAHWSAVECRLFCFSLE